MGGVERLNEHDEINYSFLNKCQCIYLSGMSISCSIIVPDAECTKTMVLFLNSLPINF